ncbi:hypothetical protein Syun_014271 [Stephania yunnanensis]|uniref:Vacuolar protein sorting-associated protein 13 VPS13 adaptor binding domain-containing protein n=1 Tax=Stephania yunnanensis TaxID=152371 RepID=A0AAP0JK33_9MAGN
MKQNSIWSSSVKLKGNQVSKIVDISGLGIYCNKTDETSQSAVIDNVGCLQSSYDANIKSDDYILAPFDVALTLTVNKSGKLESGVPQYSIIADLPILVLLLNEVQVRQILVLLDYLSVYQLKEKYGRYRPSIDSLSKKHEGWQRMWWCYAQTSVLSDVRRKLKKTSWRYLGWRTNSCRKYVNFYKKKLDSLGREQPVDKSILIELEQMEKESDFDDILTYRTIAEHESQDILLSSKPTNMQKSSETVTSEKPQNEDCSAIKSRGWLNWLSLGMLGAGGTEDSIQFSGVVSDEIIKDIFEATEFHPQVSVDGSVATKKQDKEAVKVTCDGVIIEGKYWEESCNFLFSVNSVVIANPQVNNVLLLTTKGEGEQWLFSKREQLRDMRESYQSFAGVDDLLRLGRSCRSWPTAKTAGALKELHLCSLTLDLIGSLRFIAMKRRPCGITADASEAIKFLAITVEVDTPLLNYDSELNVKVLLQPIEVTYDSDVLLNLFDFVQVLASFKFHNERCEELHRLFGQIRPLSNCGAGAGACVGRLELGAINFKSVSGTKASVSVGGNQQNCLLADFQCSKSTEDLSAGVLSQDLYEQFKVLFSDFKVKIVLPDCRQGMTIFERFDASVTLMSCIIPYESQLKQLEVQLTSSPLDIHFSVPIYVAIMGMLRCLVVPKPESAADNVFNFSVSAKLQHVNLHANIADNAENNLVLFLFLEELEMGYCFLHFMEYHISLKTITIDACSSVSETCSRTLCSSRSISLGNSGIKHGMGDAIGVAGDDCGQSNISANGCFLLHYKTQKSEGLLSHKYRLWLNDIDLHLYPGIFGLLLNFGSKLSGYGTSAMTSSLVSKENEGTILLPDFVVPRFGFSNFFEVESDSLLSGIPLDQFPFITIKNSGSLGNLEESLIYGIPEWRKALNVCDNNSVKIPRFSEVQRTHMSSVPATKPSCSLGASSECGRTYDTDIVFLDLIFNRTKVHFHDASCIIGAVTLPVSKSSLIIYDSDYFTMLCSLEGLLVSSSWSAQDRHEVLWDSSVPDLSPILNICLKKEKRLVPEIEISIGIQHVCCLLPVDFLAMLIGYFSLPDWTSNESEPCLVSNNNNNDTVGHTRVIYKLEILDCLLILPLESNKHECLHLELRQLYCSFRQCNRFEDAFADVPSDCMVQVNKVANDFFVPNFFGRDLCLFLVLPKDGEFVSADLDQDVKHKKIPLIAQMNADLWIRIPCNSDGLSEQTPPTYVMMRIQNCQVVAEDECFIFGVEAVLDVIDQISLIDIKSKGFTSDVLQFLQFSKSLKEGNLVLPKVSDMSLTDVKILASSMSINLGCNRRSHLISSELIAKADLQFDFCASFRDDVPIGMDIYCSHLLLRSFCSSSTLVEFLSEDHSSYALIIHLSRSDLGRYELLVDLMSAHVWLHLLDWSEIIELLVSYSKKLFKTSFINESNADSNSLPISGPVKLLHNDTESQGCSISTSSEKIEDNVSFIMRSEDIRISLHFPLSVKQAAIDEGMEAGPQQKMSSPYFADILEQRKKRSAKSCTYIALILNSKDCELVTDGHHAKLKCSMEKINGISEIVEDQRILSWTLFELFQVDVIAETIDQHEKQRIDVDFRSDSLDVRSSQKILDFWHGLELESPQTGSSQIHKFTVTLKVQLRKASLLLTDGRWSCNAPLLEVLVRNLLLLIDASQKGTEVSIVGDLMVNYKSIHSVMWEPFIEPWGFELKMIQIHRQSALLNTFVTTDIHLKSMTHLNLNVTEPLIEYCEPWVNELVRDAWNQVGFIDHRESQSYIKQTRDDTCTIYAPYILKNETSLPLSFQVSHGLAASDNFDILKMKEEYVVHPGSSIPIFIDETPEEHAFHLRPPQSSDSLNDKSFNGVQHLISIKVDGTSRPSIPISMDVVGLNYVEVNFSKASEKKETPKNEDSWNIEDRNGQYSTGGFVVPVVLDVSVQQYSKLIRLYSTVILSNSTSMPLELRFDIPFGVSPKVLDPIYPGQEFPLPLHLAEAGLMRWRPLDKNYLWSEAQQLSNLLSMENKSGFLRSFVCYPSHLSSDPFRCCISVQHINLPSSTLLKEGHSILTRASTALFEDQDQRGYILGNANKRFIHYVTLTTPLFVRSYIPHKVSVTIECGGISRTVVLSEAGSSSVFHVDSTHDLGLLFHVHGFSPCTSKFQRAETFATVSKLNETKFSSSESLVIRPDSCTGPIYVVLEKVVDALCGARELCISVPFLLYNCTGLPLAIAEFGNEIEGNSFSIPSCYHLDEVDKLLSKKHGLALVTSEQDSHKHCSTSKNNPLALRESSRLCGQMSLSTGFTTRDSVAHSLEHKSSTSQLQASECDKEFDVMDSVTRTAKACIYSPHPSSSASELMVRLSLCLPESNTGDATNSVWSSSFFLVPPSGSTSVVVPQTSTSGAFIISATSSKLSPFSGRTRAITFQPRQNKLSQYLALMFDIPRYLILQSGEQSHLHLADTTKELLISLRFNEPGWMWSGSFSPDHLGDTQVKMRNYVSGAVYMIRVEIQNADVPIKDEKIVGSTIGKSGTLLILLSDDNTGFMPYRIDNFSMEKLRVYQQKCEVLETVVHSYTSCPYAWDEPCFPHRLVVEVPGECVLGSYALDVVKEQTSVYLPSTSEIFQGLDKGATGKHGLFMIAVLLNVFPMLGKVIGDDSPYTVDRGSKAQFIMEKGIALVMPNIRIILPKKPGRRLFLAIHAEGAIKVLSIINSSHHLLKDMKETCFHGFKEKRKVDQKQELMEDYNERVSLHFTFIGISVINSIPQEVLFVSANDTKIDILQHMEQQKLFFHISSLQIDNQLVHATYPVLLSFDHDVESNSVSNMKTKDDKNLKSKAHTSAERSCQSVFYLAAAKWRNKEISLVSFEYISLRLAPLRIELEEEVILYLLNFFRTVVSRLRNSKIRCPDSEFRDLAHENCSSSLLPSVVPIGAPWQQIYLLARRQKKIYVEVFDLSHIKLALSFSSAPWMLKNEGLISAEYLGNVSGTVLQRGLLVLADVEEAPVLLRELIVDHHMGSWESFQEILIRHYTRQLLHETYKIFGSAGVIGNPMGFARNLGLGIKDFLSVPARGIFQSPAGLIIGMAQGTSSLLSNTVYAVSNATTQFSKSVQKSIVALTFDDQAVSRMEKQQKAFLSSQSKGLLNEFLEGLTGFLQSPVRGAEKHGLPGVLSGIALGTAGLVARPVASILEVTGKTAQSIRNRSRLHRPRHFRVRFPRPLVRGLPTQPYSWEEAIGATMLLGAADAKLKDEIYVKCKALKQTGTFVIITKRLIIIFSCSSLVELKTSEFHIVADPEWVIQVEMGLETVIHVDREKEVLNIVGSRSETLLKQPQQKKTIARTKWSTNTSPLFQMNFEFKNEEEAEEVLQVILSTFEHIKEHHFGVHVLHQSNLRQKSTP